ncbi:GTP cyclohydrolase 1 type 2 [Rubripirellula tenax]|uniref:GTP cyclohydrolase 1 type 2 homolog n=2 Tax=Rubripirellula tenax TaxID=2528015 RepID=A0A5C6FG61_9BACT|nr:GTP cyclohydrolase 1 type 2 [Rubripirellula tenax]
MAPLKLAEDWDNVGLLLGDRRSSIAKVMTCLTITPDVVEEAVESNVDLIVTHHPLPFKPLTKITTDSVTGKMLWRLVGAKIAVYSAHTAFDSAACGINQRWAESLELHSIEALVPSDAISDPKQLGTCLGAGRLGRLGQPVQLGQLASLAAQVAGHLNSEPKPRIVGSADDLVGKIAIACGSGGSFLAPAARRGCDALITGEATFHTCLEARSQGISLVLLGHYRSERFAMEFLSQQLSAEFPDLETWASRHECDPISPLG